MDDKGFIFTLDASLALIVVMVLSASIVTYTLLPIYQGEDHQHLETLADSALESMDQNGTLKVVAAEYANGSTTKAENDLRSSLDQLIPSGIGYKIYVGDNPAVISNDSSRYPATSNDVVTKIRVVGLPKEGWMGRAYYKLDMVNFTTYNMNTTTTVWNFHNWLTNFQPWKNSGMNTAKYWGGSSSGSSQKATNITFYVPTTTGQINGAKILIGSAFDRTRNNPSAFGADFYLNGILSQSVNKTYFQYLYTGQNDRMYSYQSNLTGYLLSGSNNFYLRLNASQYNDMPWFSILANYTTSVNAPVGIVFPPAIYFNDIAGVGNPSGGINYTLDNGTITNVTGRSVTWDDLQDSNYNLDTNTPFELTGLPNTDKGSAVASVENVYLPPGSKLLDAYTVVNAFGGVDGAIVQVRNPGGGWRTVFTSFGNFTARGDGGYGNLPGIISLHDSDLYKTGNDYLQPGNNQVRVIIWDNVPSSDYDLVGLESSYTQIAYTSLPIQWDTFNFNSYQNHSDYQSTQSLTESRNFHIDYGAMNVMLFLGTGLDTRSITVQCNNSSTNWETLYTGNVPYVLNLTSYDSKNMFTTVTANGTVPKRGNYTLTVTITPAKAYESGDLASNTGSWGDSADPEIFSGTRISIFYPQFLENMWTANFNTTAEAAKKNASDTLVAEINSLGAPGFSVNQSLVRTEALWAGDLPDSTPIRLELWKQ